MFKDFIRQASIAPWEGLRFSVAMAGRSLYLIIVFLLAFDWSVEFLEQDVEDVLICTVVLFIVLSFAGFKMGTLPSSTAAREPARTVLSIIDENTAQKGTKKRETNVMGNANTIQYGKISF